MRLHYAWREDGTVALGWVTTSVRTEELRGMPDQVHIDKIDSSVEVEKSGGGAFSRLFDSLFRRHKDASDQARGGEEQAAADRSLDEGGRGRPPT